MASEKPSINEKLEALRHKYEQALPGRIHHVRSLWNAIDDGDDQDKYLREMHRAIHTLSGSGATFGYAAISDAARSIEQLLQPAGKSVSYPAAPEIVIIENLLDALEQGMSGGSESIQFSSPDLPAIAGEIRDRDIYLVEQDADLARETTKEIAHSGYAVTVFSCLEELEARLAMVCPGAIIMDISHVAENTKPGSILERLTRLHDPPPPLVFLSQENSFEPRLYAVRAGAAAYFPRPVDDSELLGTLNRLTGQTEPAAYRILVIEDDLSMAKDYASVLESAGMVTSILNDPMMAIGRIIDFNPDLILIDLYMPGCNGIELAQVIRQQTAYTAIPLVFLSSEISQDKQSMAIKFGGDAFLTKPVEDSQLISSVTSRAARFRTVRGLMMRDGLTGLLDHANIKDRLRLEVSRAARTAAKFTFAMIDIDHFKLVNDTYGHPTGDQVIKSLAQLLTRRLRKSDIIGRYGGEEFAVILINTDKYEAQKIIDNVRQDFADIHHQSGEKTFSVTFSCGIAQYSDFTTDDDLNRAADDALYQAKYFGRNGVSLAMTGP